MDKYGLFKIQNPYAKFLKTALLGAILVLTSILSVTTGFFGFNSNSNVRQASASTSETHTYEDITWTITVVDGVRSDYSIQTGSDDGYFGLTHWI